MDVIELASDLIRCETVNPPGNEAPAAALVANWLTDAGFDVTLREFAPSRTSVVARLEGTGEKPAIGFSGHLDTVGIGDASWSHNPFGAEIHDGRLYGRGSSDMKGAIAAMVIGLARLQDLGKLRGGIEVVLTAGEETGCVGASHLASGGALGRPGALIVGEATKNYPLVANKGALWLSAVARGRSAHGSTPHLGENAIYAIVDAVRSMRSFDFEVSAHPLVGLPSLSVGMVAGGTHVNSVPDLASAAVDVRTVPGQDHSELVRRLSDAMPENVDIEVIADLAPIESSVEDSWIKDVFALHEEVTGQLPTARGASFFTDASALATAYGAIPVVTLGPGDPDVIHQESEYCIVDDLIAAADVYFEIARRWCM